MPSISYLTAVLVWYLVYIGLTDTLWGLALPVGLMWIPFCIRAIQSSLESIDPALEEVAVCCGASPISAFLRITLPLVAPGLLAGGLLVFAASMNSFLEPLMLGGSHTVTVAQEIYQDLARGSIAPFIASEALFMQLLTLSLLLAVTAMGRRYFRGILY
jgi:putative spermidine/putrescine transport system permease protein